MLDVMATIPLYFFLQGAHSPLRGGGGYVNYPLVSVREPQTFIKQGAESNKRSIYMASLSISIIQASKTQFYESPERVV